MYIMVPRENLTKGRWGETLELFREMPESQIPEYHPPDPDEPIFEGEKEPSELVIHGKKWYFHAHYVKDSSWAEAPWPVPNGMGLICADNLWDKSGPFDDTMEEYNLVGGAVITGLGGDFANYSNELTSLEVETYTGFLECNYNSLLLSKRVSVDVGLDNLQQFGTVTDKGTYILLGYDESKGHFGPELYDLLKTVDYLRPDSEMSPPPSLDEDAIGVKMRRVYHSNEKSRCDRERKRQEGKAQGRALFDKEFEQKYGHVFDLE